MLRSVLKAGIRSSMLAFDKVKYGLGCLKEDIEDITAEVKSEIRTEAHTVQSAETQKAEPSVKTTQSAETKTTVNPKKSPAKTTRSKDSRA